MGNRDGSGPSLVTERERGSTEASRLNVPYCRGICNDASSPLYRLFRSLCPARSRSILLRHHLGLKALPKDSDIL